MKDEMTQEQLAEKVQCSRWSILAIEKGGDTSLTLALKIADALDLSLDSLRATPAQNNG